MNITRLSIKRPVGITMIFMLIVVLGLFSLNKIGVELLPNVETPYVMVSVNYSGAGPEQIEQSVVKPLENALSSVTNLKKMTSMASSENARIILEFELGTNTDYASIEATKLVNSIRRRLPDGIDEPTVLKRDMNADSVLEIAVTSKYSLSDTYSKADNVFKEVLARADGVSDVSVYGGRTKEIAVEVNKDKLLLYNLSLNQIVNRIIGENSLLPSGSVYTEKKVTDVRMDAQYKTPADIEQIHISSTSGENIPLTEIATVRAQDEKVDRYSRANGEDAISMSVYKKSDANIVATVDAVLRNLETLRKDFPDYQFTVINNSADYVSRSLQSTFHTLIEGIITTSLVLYLFLRGWRSTAAVIVAIPTSLISTFFVMYLAGFTFNMMSLLGMILCVGILVDDSIVVLENIHRHMHLGKDSNTAAEEGRTEIGMAAIAITLCDVVVFMPIAFMNGMTGQFFRQFGLTIVFATLCSLFVSFTLTPMMASQLFKNGLKQPQGKLWTWLDNFERSLISKYEQILRASLAGSKKIVAAVLVLFVLSILLIPTGVIGAEYMPKTDEGSFQVSVQLPEGSNLDQSDTAVRKLEEYISTLPEVTNYLARAGSPSENYGSITVQLVSSRERSRNIWQITDDVRKFARQNLRDVSVRVSETQASVAGVSQSTGSRGGATRSPIQVELLGSDNNAIVAASYRVQDIISGVRGTKDIFNSYTEGMPEIKLTVDRDKLKFYNTTVSDITDAFSAAISGRQAGYLANDPNNNGNDTKINVRLINSDVFKAADIRSLPIQANGRQVALGEVAHIEDGTGPTFIRRVDKQRSIFINANITDRPLQEVVEEIRMLLDKENLGSQGISYRFQGQATSMDDTFKEMLQALGLSLILIYILLAVLYESFSTPFIRMFSLPLGLIGSLIFLAITHNSINLYSLIGILVMDGLVAKNGTLLLDYTLTLMERGMPAYDAIIEAGKTRLKPIIMTTLTMVTGMLPMALSFAEGMETRVSMAWVIIGGLLSSTIFTLIIIPIIFIYLERHPLHRCINIPKLYAEFKARIVSENS